MNESRKRCFSFLEIAAFPLRFSKEDAIMNIILFSAEQEDFPYRRMGDAEGERHLVL